MALNQHRTSIISA